MRPLDGRHVRGLTLLIAHPGAGPLPPSRGRLPGSARDLGAGRRPPGSHGASPGRRGLWTWRIAVTHVTVVGSGPSGVHFALTLLGKGYRVTLLDAGDGSPAQVRPEDDLRTLKNNLEDPVEYFLGADFESVILPDSKEEFYGFPPSKMYLF